MPSFRYCNGKDLELRITGHFALIDDRTGYEPTGRLLAIVLPTDDHQLRASSCLIYLLLVRMLNDLAGPSYSVQ